MAGGNGGPIGMNVDGSMSGVVGGPGGAQQMMNAADKSGGALANVAQWVHDQNVNLQQERTSFMGSGGAGPGVFGLDGGPPGAGMKQFGNGGRGGMPPVGGPRGMDMGGGCPPPGYGMCGPGPPIPGYMLDPRMSQADLLHCKVPNENLTPEQLQRREEKMASVRKIKQLLFPEQPGSRRRGGSPSDEMMIPPGGMMMPDGPDGMPQEMWPTNGPLGGPPQFMHPNMRGIPPEMIGSPHDDMNFAAGPGGQFIGGGGLMGDGMVPPNWDSMTPPQREWFKLQQDHYLEKCCKQQHQMQQMGPGGLPPGARGQFFNPMQQRMGPSGPMSPISPSSFMGGGGCGPMQSPLMIPPEFGGGHVGFPSGHPMCGVDPRFDRGGAGMPPDRMFPFHDGPVMMPGGGRMGGGPPGVDQFNRDMNPHMMMGGMGPGGPHHGSGPHMGGMMPKMPPMYGMSGKRKRSAASMANDSEDMFKHLLPAPSPQQFSYVDPLEGQELVITKQVGSHVFPALPI